MKKILSVVGATASGKTSYAINVAKKVLIQNIPKEIYLDQNHKYDGVDLISADSRQVYQGLEILSGADIPNNFEKIDNQEYKVFKHEELEIYLHGVSIIGLRDEWSVAHFKDFATKIILDSFKNNRLPILVGGTGLYHEHLFSKDENLYVPPDSKLREKAQILSLNELQKWLESINPEKLKSMNNSDINNPRRLIRAIEIAIGTPQFINSTKLPNDVEIQTILVGVDMSLENFQEKILKRVIQRFDNGSTKEVENLLRICEQNDLPVCSTLGVSDISKYISAEISKEVCIRDWALHEFQYAKRQLTWFKKKI